MSRLVASENYPKSQKTRPYALQIGVAQIADNFVIGNMSLCDELVTSLMLS